MRIARRSSRRCLPPARDRADPAAIAAAPPERTGDGWRFAVTLRYGEAGRDDDAVGWRVEMPDGTVLGTCELLYPHVDEQPFTRSLCDVTIPGRHGRGDDPRPHQHDRLGCGGEAGRSGLRGLRFATQ